MCLAVPSRRREWKIPSWYQWEALGCQAGETTFMSISYTFVLCLRCLCFFLKKRVGNLLKAQPGCGRPSSLWLWSSFLAGCKLRAFLFLEVTARPGPWCLLPSPKLARDAERLSHLLVFFSIYLFGRARSLLWFLLLNSYCAARQNPGYFMYVIIFGLPDSSMRWTSFLFGRWRNHEWGRFSPGTWVRR